MKRKLAFILCIILILTLIPFSVLAATHSVEDGQTLNLTTGELTSTQSGALITTFTINAGDTISVAPLATAEITGGKNVMISCGAGVELTINDLISDVSGTKYACALSFTGAGNKLNLVGNSKLKSWGDWAVGEPGIRVESGSELTIGSETGGSVEAAGGGQGGAGIGGAYQKAGGNISITGGVVKANGGREGAGIGGGSRGAGGNIDITDGKVEAYGGNEGGAGIGGGSNADCGVVNISGGIVVANGGLQSAGIGGGQAKTGGIINISGGRVEAKGGLYGGTGIGGGYGGSGGDINISGGEVYADGCVDDYVDDIGNGGLMPNGGTLEISGNAAVFMRHSESYSLTPTTSCHVHRSDESIAAGTPYGSAYGFSHIPGDWTGTAYAYLTSTLLIDDEHINAVGSTETDVDKLASYINKININTTQPITIKDYNKTARNIQIEALCEGVKLTIEDLELDVSGTPYACALAFMGTGNTLKLVGDSELTSSAQEPGIRVEDATVLTIDSQTNGSVTADGGEYGAGIGGGFDSSGGNINVNGGTVTANGGVHAAGIGGGMNGTGNEGAGGDIDITGGTVTANGGDRGAGIGGGGYAVGGDIDITGGTVTANGGKWAAGIGGGFNRAGADIDITGGTVTAKGGDHGAGIGGGYRGMHGNINITGGTIKAGGGLYAAGIGCGYQGGDGDINISGGTVTAKGGIFGGPGIGGGNEVGANINIRGGEVYADGYIDAGANDIGKGAYSASSGTLEISGDAAVFMRHSASNSLTPTTLYHEQHSGESINETSPFGSAYGFLNIPDDWSGTAYAYLTSTLLIDDAYINAVGSTETDVDKIAHTINKININTSQEITIKDSNKTARDIQIEALCGDVKLTIEDLELDVSGTTNWCALAFTGTGNKLNLVGDSELTSSGISSPDGAPGIRVETGTGLIINSVSDGTVTVNGGHRCAGIGGGSYSGSGDIDITGGTVTANGGMYAAGIGGGYRGAGGNINIAGGSVKASGGFSGSGIGCGQWGGGGVIDISGGMVTAKGGSLGGPGIGGGCEINISGGEVYADGDISKANDIGKSWSSTSSGTLEISGDAVVFTRHDPSLHSLTPTTSYHTLHSDESINVTSLFGSAYGFAHIPKGWSGTAYAYLTSTLLIDDAYINAVGTAVTDVDKLVHTIKKIDVNTSQEITIRDTNKTARNIQIEALCGDVKLTIQDLEIDVSGTTNGCALAFTGTGNTLNLVGDSELTSWGNINTSSGQAGIRVEEGTQLSIGSVTGGKVIVTGGQVGAAIGGGYKGNGGDINIGGDATITATGGRCGAGIGGGYEGNGGDINIGGDATVTATAESGGGAAGIGGGYKGNGGNINITGGTVVSNGDDAGIGGGYYGAGGDIDISGGTVEAIGGSGAAGIGGGYKGAWGDIDISGDATVTAAGGDHGAGIGGGLYGAGGNINISGGQVYADGSIATEAQDIGKGNHGSDDGLLNIRGDAAVFTRHNPAAHSLTPSTSYHSLRSDESIVETSPYGSAYGYTHIPDEWSGTAYAYLWTILLIDDAYISAVGSTETDIDNLAHTINKINISTSQEITIKDSNKTARNIQIKALCGDVKLTIEDLELDVSSTTNGCALAFTGTGNTLNLVGNSELKSWGSDSIGGEPGIRVESGTALSISSSSGGAVTAGSEYYGAGIGGGYKSSGGDIEIIGGTVTATGGYSGAGIGGGDKGSGGNIHIGGDATVTATSGRFSAGIGGGLDGSGGHINISGGTVTANGDDAGIGSGCNGEGGDIDITGGTVEANGGSGAAGVGSGYGCESGGDIDISGDAKVTANGGDYGAGIGGGIYGACGDINISGGVVYASGDSTNGAHDIGNGVDSSGSGTLEISGDAAVFLKNDFCTSPTTATHTHEVITSVTDNKVYGIDANGWIPNFGVYMRLYTLTYSANQGTGTVPEPVTQRYETTIEVEDNSNLSRYSYTLGGWNTKADGNGTIYNVGDTFEFDANITLFAEWNEISVSSVTLSSNSETMVHHDTLTLTADVVPTNATHPEVEWKSSNPDVAPVDSSGKVTAVGVGYAVITATADGKSDTCAIIVNKKAVTSVALSSNKETMVHHDTLTLTADVVPTNATYRKVTWESSNTDVATVDESGKVTAVGVGSATITATADGKSDTCAIIVNKKAVTSVSLPASETMIHHDTLTLTADVVPANATYVEVTWESSNTDVATVDESGKVTAVGVGSATITATADGKSDTCEITVNKKAVTSVALSSNKETMAHHETITLTADAAPSNATYPEVTYKSNNTHVATVDEFGKVTAVGVGSATISATADGKSDICTITVNKKAVTSINLSSTEVTLEMGDIETLTVQVAPKNATYPKVEWTSSNTNVAEVDEAGKVTAVGAGSATITAEADGVSGSCEVTVNADDAAPTQTDDVALTPEPSAITTPSDETAKLVKVVKEDEETGDVVVEIDVANLPEGTDAIKTPSGEVINITGMDKVEITLSADEINEDGTVDLVALNEEGTPFGTHKIFVPQADKHIEASGDTDNADGGVWPILMWVIIGLAGAGAIGTAGYFVLKKSKA